MNDTGLNVGGEAVAEPVTAGQERFLLLDAGKVALVQDTSSGEVVGVQLLLGGVIANRHGAMHTLDLLEGAMRMTGWRIDQVVRLPADVSETTSVQ